MPSRFLVGALFLSALWTSQTAAQTVVHEAGEPGLEPPRLLESSRVPPVLPEEALREGVQGTVLLRVVVSADGLVSDLQVFRSPYRGELLAQAALKAVRQWRYAPAQWQGRHVACRIMQPVPFYRKTEPTPRRGRRTRRSQAPEPTRPVAVAPLTVEEAESPPSALAEGPPASEVGAGAAKSPVPVETAVAEDQPIHATPVSVPVRPLPAPVKPGPAPGSRLAIDLRAGGHGAVLLGGQGARESLPDAEERQGGRVLRLPRQGMEVTLASPADGEQIVAIRYLFTEGGGFSASALRTRKGLGRGSFCLGITPAYGRPDERQESIDADGNTVLILSYRGKTTHTRFRCRNGRLAELTLERVPE